MSGNDSTDTNTTYMHSVFEAKRITSIIILIPYIFLFLAYGFKASLQSLNHKFTFQLCLSSIIYSMSFLINPTEENTYPIPFHCRLQGFMNIFGECCCILFTVAIAILTLISYKYSYILKNNQKLITIINIVVWGVATLFGLFCLILKDAIAPDVSLLCWFHRDHTLLQGLYFVYLLLAYIFNAIILLYVKINIKQDLKEEGELDKYPQYVKKINIQLTGLTATYCMFLVWLVMDKVFIGQAQDEHKVLYFIAEIGECLTGILIPLAYGINQEILDFFMSVVTCGRYKGKPSETEQYSELRLTKDDVDEVKKISLIDASNIRNLSQFDEVDDDL